MTLEEYFHRIVSKPEPKTTIGYEPSWVLVPINQPIKHEDEGVNMFFQKVKEYAQSLKASWSTLYAWDNAVQHTKAYEALHSELEQAKADLETLSMEDYWAFEIHTGEWVDEFNEVRPAEHDIIIKDNDSTWHELLDQILDVMEKHYGYNIKEQVYYSVQFPLNREGMTGHGRMLNDEVLQQLLLAYPEVYETRVTDFEWKPL